MDLDVVGKWAFIAGLVVALLAGFFAVPMVALVLFVVGLIVGFLNVTAKDTEKFLLATVTLLVLGVGSIQTLAVLGTAVSATLSTVLGSMIAFVGAAALVVAVKAVVELAQ